MFDCSLPQTRKKLWLLPVLAIVVLILFFSFPRAHHVRSKDVVSPSPADPFFDPSGESTAPVDPSRGRRHSPHAPVQKREVDVDDDSDIPAVKPLPKRESPRPAQEPARRVDKSDQQRPVSNVKKFELPSWTVPEQPHPDASKLRVVDDVRAEKDGVVVWDLWPIEQFARPNPTVFEPNFDYSRLARHPNGPQWGWQVPSGKPKPTWDDTNIYPYTGSAYVMALRGGYVGEWGAVYDQQRYFALDPILSYRGGLTFEPSVAQQDGRRIERHTKLISAVQVLLLLFCVCCVRCCIAALLLCCLCDIECDLTNVDRLSQKWGDNFFHFVMETLPRVALVTDLLRTDPDIKLLVPVPEPYGNQCVIFVVWFVCLFVCLSACFFVCLLLLDRVLLLLDLHIFSGSTLIVCASFCNRLFLLQFLSMLGVPAERIVPYDAV